MNISGIPLHPLFVHAAVIFIPLSAIAAVAFVLKPQWRYLTRWPTALTNVAGVLALATTRGTGEILFEELGPSTDILDQHVLFAGILTAVAAPLMLLTLFACWSFPSESGFRSGAGAREGRYDKAQPVVTWIIVILAVATLIFTVLTGHAGATSTWTQ